MTLAEKVSPSGIAAEARPLRACMLAYTFYEGDGRVMRYAQALVNSGAEVDAITLGRHNQPSQARIDGVDVYRIQRRRKNEHGQFAHFFRVLGFLLRSFGHVTARHLRRPYDVIHVHSVPDFEVFATGIAKLLGAKVILDIHDLVPEFYAAKFSMPERSLAVRILKLIEKSASAFADHVIIANDLWLETIIGRSVDRGKCTAFINYPDLDVFRRSLRTVRDDGEFVLIYPGSLNWHQGLDLAIQAFAIALRDAPGMRFHIYGEGSAKPDLERLVIELGLSKRVFLHPPMPLREIAVVMANADLGVVPKRNDSFGNEAFSTKTLEFMALGVPVLIADTRIDRHYFNDTLVAFFKSGDRQALAAAMSEAYHDRLALARRADRAVLYAEQNAWGVKSPLYLALVRQLVGGRPTQAEPGKPR